MLKDFLRRKFLRPIKENKSIEFCNAFMEKVKIKRSDFACKCGCGQVGMDYELMCVIIILTEELENILDSEIIAEVTSGNRCVTHNSNTPGAFVNSYHTKGIAGDFKFKYKSTNKYIDGALLYNVACRLFPKKYGIGQYPNRVHLDVRSKKGRW